MNSQTVLEEACHAAQRAQLLRKMLARRGHEIAREVRAAVGLDQKDMARKLGVSRVHLCYVETGVRPLTPELAVKMLQVLRKAKGK